MPAPPDVAVRTMPFIDVEDRLPDDFSVAPIGLHILSRRNRDLDKRKHSAIPGVSRKKQIERPETLQKPFRIVQAVDAEAKSHARSVPHAPSHDAHGLFNLHRPGLLRDPLEVDADGMSRDQRAMPLVGDDAPRLIGFGLEQSSRAIHEGPAVTVRLKDKTVRL